MPETWITSLCYSGGLIGYFLTWWIGAFLPLYLWWSLYGKAGDVDLRAYFSLYYNTYLPTWIFLVIMRDVVIRSPPIYPYCNNLDFAMPSIESGLLAQYYVMGVLHHLYFELPISPIMALRAMLIIITTIGLLWWSNYYSAGDLFVGVGFGALMGGFFSYTIFDFWLPRFPIFGGSKWAGWLGCSFRSMPIVDGDPTSLERWYVL